MRKDVLAKAVFAGLLGLCSGMAVISADGVKEEWELWTVAAGTLAAAGVTTRERGSRNP